MRSALRSAPRGGSATALNRGERLMGFGHRVYRTRDPRADVLKCVVATLPASSGRLALAQAIEGRILQRLAAEKPDRKLDTNVEYYTAILLEALGVPRGLFTAMFAMRARDRLDRACARAAGHGPAGAAGFGLCRTNAGRQAWRRNYFAPASAVCALSSASLRKLVRTPDGAPNSMSWSTCGCVLRPGGARGASGLARLGEGDPAGVHQRGHRLVLLAGRRGGLASALPAAGGGAPAGRIWPPKT